MDELENIKKLLASAEAEERRLAAAREKLEVQHASAKERVDLLRRLVGLAGGSRSSREERTTSTATPVPKGGTDGAQTLEDLVQGILAAAGAPIHIGKIRAALIDGGVRLPGRGDEANIIVRIARDERFVRTGRGTYGLRAWGVDEVRPTRKRRSSRGAS